MKWFAAEWFICGVHHSLEIRCMFWGAIASPLTSECLLAYWCSIGSNSGHADFMSKLWDTPEFFNAV